MYLLKMSIFVQNLKVHAKNTHICTYNHHSNEPLLAAILALEFTAFDSAMPLSYIGSHYPDVRKC